MLMMNQRGRQHLVGKLEKFHPERAGDHRGVFDEVGHLLQQAGVALDDAADAALQALGLRIELARNLVVALAALEHHEVLEEPRAILVERCAP